MFPMIRLIFFLALTHLFTPLFAQKDLLILDRISKRFLNLILSTPDLQRLTFL